MVVIVVYNGKGTIHGLRYKTRTTDYGLGIIHGLRYKTRTTDYGQRTGYKPMRIDTANKKKLLYLCKTPGFLIRKAALPKKLQECPAF